MEQRPETSFEIRTDVIGIIVASFLLGAVVDVAAINLVPEVAHGLARLCANLVSFFASNATPGYQEAAGNVIAVGIAPISIALGLLGIQHQALEK